MFLLCSFLTLCFAGAGSGAEQAVHLRVSGGDCAVQDSGEAGCVGEPVGRHSGQSGGARVAARARCLSEHDQNFPARHGQNGRPHQVRSSADARCRLFLLKVTRETGALLCSHVCFFVQLATCAVSRTWTCRSNELTKLPCRNWQACWVSGQKQKRVLSNFLAQFGAS
jgi:hypothetical protein